MNISELLESYQSGNYNRYFQLIGGSSLNNDMSKINKDLAKLANLNEIASKYLLLNNGAVCHAIIQLKRDEQKWLESLNSFIKLYSNYKSLLAIPVEIEMNVVYNMLWWFWTKPQSLQSSTYHLKNVLKALSWCLIKVLRSRGEVVLGQEMCSDDVSSVVNVLKLASDQLLSLKPVACIQLLDTITITVQVLLGERIAGAAAECMSFMTKIVNQIDLLRLHIGKIKTAGNEEFYFKFGFNCVNSTASLKNSKDSIEAFIITSSLNCAVNEQYDQAISCFKGISEEEGSCNFMMNYLKAHCYLMSHRLDEAKLCLAYAMSAPVPPAQLAHYRLLLARLLAAQGDHQSALAQCDAVLASHAARPALASLAAHLAAQQAGTLSATTAELGYLRQLVQEMKTDLTEQNGHFESFEECCLLTLSHHVTITMPEALYTLARQLYLAGYHVKSLDSYKELLELLTQVVEASVLLPPRPQLVQECTLAYIKSNSLPEGEQLCRRLVSDHLPHTGGGRDCCRWEVALYSLDDDIISLLLLADILTASGNKRKALEELNRCHSALTEWREQARDETDLQLCDWLLSRVLLRKAKVSNTGDAAHHFRRALAHRPGDKEVMFHYKQWSLWHPDHDSFDPGDATAAVVFPADDLHNLAARHLLGCSVREEEWNHLFDRQTSQNIIESLFDDDD